jgi:apolipoprotein N-acyltransferase
MYAAVSLPNLRWLVWIGLMPLALLFDRRLPQWLAHLGAFMTCLIYYALTSLWIERFAYGVIGSAALLGAALSACLVLPPFAAARYVRQRIGVPSMALLSLTWVISDGIRGIVFRPINATGLLLVPAGLSLADYPLVFQVVGLGGVSAATLLVAAVNGSLADVVTSIFHKERGDGFRMASASVAVSATLLVLAWGYGTLVMRDEGVHGQVRVALVPSEFPGSRTSGLCSVEADVFVWPEGAMQRSFPGASSAIATTGLSSAMSRTLVEVAASLHRCIIVGVDYSFTTRTKGGRRAMTRFILFRL